MPDLGQQFARDTGAGRDLAGPTGAFADDDGSVPAPVAQVLNRRAAGLASARDVVAVLARHRLLIPLLEVDGDLLEGDDTDPCAGQDRAVAAVSMRTPEGTVGLAFTSLDSMAAWDPSARPMPSEASRVAAALLAEGGTGLLIDPASDTRCRIEGHALRRLAAGGDWPLPWRDPLVQQAVIAELAPALAAGDLSVRLAPPDEPDEAESDQTQPRGTAASTDLAIDLRFPPGTPEDVAASRASVVADRLADSAPLRAVFDGILAVRVLDSPR